MGVPYLESFESIFSSTCGHLFLGCEEYPKAGGTLDPLAMAVKIPSLMDGYAVLLAVVAFPAAHGRGAGAKMTTAGPHAVAWRMTFGTEPVGFLKLAIFSLR